jgi:hypothetical protein
VRPAETKLTIFAPLNGALAGLVNVDEVLADTTDAENIAEINNVSETCPAVQLGAASYVWLGGWKGAAPVLLSTLQESCCVVVPTAQHPVKGVPAATHSVLVDVRAHASCAPQDASY